jgi:hypothetical protein
MNPRSGEHIFTTGRFGPLGKIVDFGARKTCCGGERPQVRSTYPGRRRPVFHLSYPRAHSLFPTLFPTLSLSLSISLYLSLSLSLSLSHLSCGVAGCARHCAGRVTVHVRARVHERMHVFVFAPHVHERMHVFVFAPQGDALEHGEGGGSALWL